jgi:hypothetical protein
LAGGLAVIGALLFALLPDEIHGDTWIALMAGREVAQSGIPSHETLTIAAHGRPWIDQQWLAQLCMYELERLGGLALVAFADVLLVLVAVIGAVVGAKRLGARLRSIGWILPVAVCGLLIGLEVRTEAYAYPLLVAIVYLLASDARRPSPKVWWCLPLVVLWGNLHGSAIMAAGLVSLRGLLVGWDRRRSLVGSARAPSLGGSVRVRGKPLGLLLGGPVCLMANPYGPSIASYYRATVFNGELRKLTAEWQPVTYDTAMAIVLFVLAAIAIWAAVRHRRQSTPWERAALLILAIGAIVAVRNLPWFALATLVLLPVWIDPGVRAPAWRTRRSALLAAGLAAFGALWLAQGAVSAFTRSAAASTPDYPSGALAAVRSELRVHPGWRVYGDDAFADWLLWKLPELRGRVAADARLELLSARQLRSEVNLVHGVGDHWSDAARGCRVVVLDASGSAWAVARFRREPGARTIYDHAGAVVIVRTAAAASA